MDTDGLSKVNISEKLADVLGRIEAAALRSKRDLNAVRLIAVSKEQSVEKIREAYSLGLRDFGENRVLEALPKQEELAELDDIRWHMIGHIQSRKSRFVVPSFSMVHSVDRMKIAKMLNQTSGDVGEKLHVLLECNVSGEETKEGWDLALRHSWSKIIPVFEEILKLPDLEVRGLMTMAPLDASEDKLRAVFKTLRELKEFLAERIPGTWDELSMGMTDDFEIAIEEGATLVRIGRAIFGPRNHGSLQ